MPNTVIKEVVLYDGTGEPPRLTDVLITDKRIAALDQNMSVDGARVIPGNESALSPGFIDMHSHADFTLPSYPEAINSLSQGVTTEVIGNCGWSPAPLSAEHSDRRESWIQVASALGPDLQWSWSSFDDFLGALEESRPAVNCVPLVGHSALRTAVFGIEDRPPTSQELTLMLALLEEALSAGAFGLSSGLVYPPSSFAAAQEIHSLVQRVESSGGIYSTHLRDEGSDLDLAIDEALTVAQTTNARIQISHLKAAGPANHGRIGTALEKIDRARAEGLLVGCDVYPYLAGSTVLTQLLPSWAVVGGVEELIARLNSAEIRQRLRSEIFEDQNAYLNKAGGWGNVMVAAVDNHALKRFEGRFIPAIAQDEGKDEFEVLFDLLIADRAQSTMILFLMDSEDVDLVLDNDSAVIGSDQLGVTSREARVHPRAYGTFAKVINRATTRGEHALADTISRCTGRTARRLGLQDRGFIRPGYVADLVLFTPSDVSDGATYEQPTRVASGIDFVFVGGDLAVDNGKVVDPRLGNVLRRT